LDIAEGKPEAARQRFEALLAQHATHRGALLGLAELRAKTGGSAAEVSGLITKAISAQPTDPGPRLALIGYWVGAKEPKRAVSAAQDALAAIPNHAGIMAAAGQAFEAAGDLNQALSTYQKLASLQPSSPQPHVRMAQVQLATGDKDGALSSLQKALSLQPALLDAQRRLIALHLTSNRLQDALTVAQQVQKQRPKQSVGYILEGDIYTSRKQLPEAVAAYRRGLKQTSSTDLAMRLHGVWLKSGDQAHAKQFAATWFKEHPADEGFRLHVAQAALLQGHWQDAVEHYRKLLEKNPKNAAFLNNLAWASAQLKDPKAIEYAEQANKLAPNQLAIMDTLGQLLVDKGDTARGLELLRNAVAIAPQPQAPAIRLSLAKGLLKAGQKDAAKKELEELAKLGKKFPQYAEVQQLKQGL
jgi:putative PEP-CTERM system TPR-repeat lipoprotein